MADEIMWHLTVHADEVGARLEELEARMEEQHSRLGAMHQMFVRVKARRMLVCEARSSTGERKS